MSRFAPGHRRSGPRGLPRVHNRAARVLIAALRTIKVRSRVVRESDEGGMVARVLVAPADLDRASDYLLDAFGPSYGPVRIRVGVDDA